jgi:hypothetical protein
MNRPEGDEIAGVLVDRLDRDRLPGRAGVSRQSYGVRGLRGGSAGRARGLEGLGPHARRGKQATRVNRARTLSMSIPFLTEAWAGFLAMSTRRTCRSTLSDRRLANRANPLRTSKFLK